MMGLLNTYLKIYVNEEVKSFLQCKFTGEWNENAVVRDDAGFPCASIIPLFGQYICRGTRKEADGNECKYVTKSELRKNTRAEYRIGTTTRWLNTGQHLRLGYVCFFFFIAGIHSFFRWGIFPSYLQFDEICYK